MHKYRPKKAGKINKLFLMDCKIAKFAFSVVKEQAIGDNKV